MWCEWTKQKYRWDEQKAGSHFECEPSTHIFVVRHAVQCVPITNSKYYSTHGLCVFALLSLILLAARYSIHTRFASLYPSFRSSIGLFYSCRAHCRLLLRSSTSYLYIYSFVPNYTNTNTPKHRIYIYIQPRVVECWVKHVSEYDDGVALKACVQFG